MGFLKKISPFGLSVWPAIANIFKNIQITKLMVLVKNPVRLNFRTPLSVDFSYLLFCTFLLENNKVFRISYAFLTDFEPQGIKI